MEIEHVTHEMFVEMSKDISKRFSFSEIERCRDIFSAKYGLPPNDAIGCVFVAFAITKGESVEAYEQEKERRIAEVCRMRKNQPTTKGASK